ncbi:hypothetical protein [Actinomadura opuntiae]|uniref:hypothetical protein n=1 Tax=Actinomadura sp. OS1-43 TaxID=604315 RepID=UPI00255B3BF7|nr:hypothetical protein [Actinomadura sp. OS1-43]MDL4812758.1 hypothetical protein [Actinomadura sp. OS1-43]
MATLPAPTDVQVASGVPEVEAYRAALEELSLLRARAERRRAALEELRPSIGDTAYGRELRDRARRRCDEAAAELDQAVAAIGALEADAARAGADALARLRLSAEVRAARRAAEQAARRARQGRV